MKYASVLPSREAVFNVLDQRVHQLPSLPLVATRLLELTLDDRSCAADLARVIETDPALTAKVLRIVNSAAYGLRRKIASVSQAVALLGLASIRSLALGITFFEKMVRKGPATAFDRLFFWQHALAVAELARILAARLGYPDPEEAYIAGLLHDVGKIILETHGRKGYGEFCGRYAAGDVDSLVENESRFVGLSHDRLGAFFCAHWQLPERLVLGVLFHHGRFDHLNLNAEEAALIAIVSLANFLAWLQGMGSLKLQLTPSLQPEVTALIDLKKLDRPTIAAEMEKGLEAIAEFYGFDLPAAGAFRENLLGPNIALGRFNSQYHYLQSLLARKVRSQPAATLATCRETSERTAAVLRSIAAAYGFDRMQLMRLNARRQCLQAVASLDRTPLGLTPADFEIELNPAAGGLFKALRDRTPRIIRGHTPGEKAVLNRLQVSEIGVIPVCWKSQLAGMLWVDNAFANIKLTDAVLEAAARMAGELGWGLAVESVKPRPHKDPADPAAAAGRQRIGEAVQKAVQTARARSRDLCVALVAVENFQPTDQAIAHLAANTLARLIAGMIRNHCGPEDSVMPFGDSTFLALLNGADVRRATAFGEQLRREIAELGLLLGQGRCPKPLKASVGLASLCPEMGTWEELTRRATLALEAARADRGDRVVFYRRRVSTGKSPTPPQDNWRTIFLEKDFLSAG